MKQKTKKTTILLLLLLLLPAACDAPDKGIREGTGPVLVMPAEAKPVEPGAYRPRVDDGNAQCRSKQSAAKGNLKAIQARQKAYHQMYGKYCPDLAKLNFEMKGLVKYDYRIVQADANTFIAEATGLEAMTGDVMRIDPQGFSYPKNLCDTATE